VNESNLTSSRYELPRTPAAGIGPKAELRAFNIPVHVDSPSVGENVQDHVLHGGCLYEAPKPFVYTNSAANVSGYYKTDPSFELPDVSIVEIRTALRQPGHR
jgi:choline dehydrogenase